MPQRTKIVNMLMRAVDMGDCAEKYIPDIAYKMRPVKCVDAVYGAIFGDIAGSAYEFYENAPDNTLETIGKDGYRNSRITDDSILTLATADVLNGLAEERYKLDSGRVIKGSDFINMPYDMDAVIEGDTLLGPLPDVYADAYHRWGNEYPDAGYGGHFFMWLVSDKMKPYGSRGNGSAMRVSPIGAYGQSVEDTLVNAVLSSAVTHDDVEGIRGACVTAVAVWLAAAGMDKEGIFHYMKEVYSGDGVNLFKEYTFGEGTQIRDWQVQCPFSVPAAVIAVHESCSFEEAVEKALHIGLDRDTNACIAGAVAGALYGVPEEIKAVVNEKLEEKQKEVLSGFISSNG